MSEAGSSPTRTVARPTRPSSTTWAATSSRTLAASALPSITVAGIRSSLQRKPARRAAPVPAGAHVPDERPLERRSLRQLAEVRLEPVEDELEDIGVGLVALVDELEAPLEADDVGVRRQIRGEGRIEQPRRAHRDAVLEELRGMRERRIARRREERARGRDVHAQVVAPELELEPAELVDEAAEVQLQPPPLAQARRAVQPPVESRVAAEVAQRRPGHVGGDAARRVMGAHVGQCGQKRPRLQPWRAGIEGPVHALVERAHERDELVTPLLEERLLRAGRLRREQVPRVVVGKAEASEQIPHSLDMFILPPGSKLSPWQSACLARTTPRRSRRAGRRSPSTARRPRSTSRRT